MTLDWNSIRPLNGGRDKGFEELCAQLARAECPTESHFVRKGTPDAGVECYAVFSDGTEWGWQSKYFDTLGDSQWSQINESVKKALEKHPKLVRYYVCVPIDRADGRIDDRKSSMDRWNENQAKWRGWASDHGMKVDFIFWGSYELLERLSKPEHAGKVRLWFDVNGFDPAWFSAKLDEALRTAGPRYTPEIHIDLPIAWDLEAFGRTDRFFEREKARALGIRKKLRDFQYSHKKNSDVAIDTVTKELVSKVEEVLDGLSGVHTQPIGPLPFNAISEQIRHIETAAEDLSYLLSERARESDGQVDQSDEKSSKHLAHSNPFREQLVDLHRLRSEIESVRELLFHSGRVAESTVLIIRGDAGSGKTHLLCDVAKQRIAAGRPTILLMGQRFLSHDVPWTQALQQLDMTKSSVEEFVGALEGVAQASGARAIVVIDAINEGAGRIIWPSHLSAFLASISRSPWLGVVLSVRSSYEKIVLPSDVQARAVTITHQGFLNHEYDATRTFFIHYGLELPSTPLLSPEFRNPLFLKTLCRGLNIKGMRRLPRGFHGITDVFDLFLSAVNDRLASSLSYNPRLPLVRNSLEAICQQILESDIRGVNLIEAVKIVDAFLPGRGFDQSLYHGLVSEGILVEEVIPHSHDGREEVVFVAYERFADHITAKMLLDRHLNPNDPSHAFAADEPLSFICDQRIHVSPGLLEAFCVQVPERTEGRELISLAPLCAERWGIREAFLQSIVWRASNAFTDEARQVLNQLIHNEYGLHETIDALLTVATLPGHPFNAVYLDQRLRKDTMPERDAWWSVSLHHLWGSHEHRAIKRLVDWASSLALGCPLEDELVDLCSTTLAWIFSSSNRFLRDNATKALVCLLTNRLPSAVRLVKRFANVDDLYVLERVYAAAYGAAMRCNDPAMVSSLASCVYCQIFASGSPPPHILLRDYARGVIERALYLGAKMDLTPELIRPPYKSTWPKIPSAEEIDLLVPPLRIPSYDDGNLDWAAYRIRWSVMDDDFARYVIGTNSSRTSTTWLSLKLSEPQWRAPQSPEEQLQVWADGLSQKEQEAWEQSQKAKETCNQARQQFISDWIDKRERQNKDVILDDSSLENTLEMIKDEIPTELALVMGKVGEALKVLHSTLTAEHDSQLKAILESEKNHHEASRPPGFDLATIQRYVLWRVFDLGWTTERFGKFDRFSIGYHGRSASKAERLGKKYQWIGYHEILAYISDHYQYRDRYGPADGAVVFEGPWQISVRDIDPSNAIRSLRGGTSWDGHVPSWWGVVPYDSWRVQDDPRSWVLNQGDLPNVEELLLATNPNDGTRWLIGKGAFDWKQPAPVDKESTAVERRELWINCTGYLIRRDDASRFVEWAEGVDFWGRWMPEAPEVWGMFLGEHGWAPASRYYQHPYYGEEGWVQPGHGCPVKIRTITFEYLKEKGGFDCSVDEGYTLKLPTTEIVAGMKLRWRGNGADYPDANGLLAAQDPTVSMDGPTAFLLRKDLFQRYLDQENQTLCWTIQGEKRVQEAGFGTTVHHPALRLMGALYFSDRGFTGFVRYVADEYVPGNQVERMTPTGTRRIERELV